MDMYSVAYSIIMQNLQYPIGKFVAPASFSRELINEHINIIKLFPEKIKKATAQLTEDALNKTYRPEGWTIRQVVHHCADSHMNSIIRLKLALSEDKPTVKAYNESAWAELADSKTFPINASLQIIEGVHERWVAVLESISDDDFQKSFVHPTSGREMLLFVNTALYAWHCDHHLAHIQSALMSEK